MKKIESQEGAILATQTFILIYRTKSKKGPNLTITVVRAAQVK
jgi:hypothetical protein